MVSIIQNLNTRKVIRGEYIEMLSTMSINKMIRIQDHYLLEIILTSSLDFFISIKHIRVTV